MKLVASMIVAEVEKGRYLTESVGALLDFCDEVVLLFDRDGDFGDLVGAWGAEGYRVIGAHGDSVDFFAHEGRARQKLIDATLAREPTHVLAIDADEFVSDGAALRYAAETEMAAGWTLCMEEVWKATPGGLQIRQDGGWEEHEIVALWRVDQVPAHLRLMRDRALACGRVPYCIRHNQAPCIPAAILHFGWANESERVARHHRYAVADGGQYHASAHLDSILLPDDEIRLTPADWPVALTGRRDAILARTEATR